MTGKIALACLPFALPLNFAEQLGYQGDRRFIAAHWEPLGDEVTVRDDSSVSTGFDDRYVWGNFFRQQPVRTWLWNMNVNLGNSDEAATHWLIIDRVTGHGFIAECELGHLIIQQQRLTNLE